MPLLSLRAYAKHRGVSLAAVQKAIHSGRITANADGLIDSDRADAEWAAKTRPGQRRARPAPPAVPARGDEVEIGGVRYKVFDIEADPEGAAVLKLRKTA
jgi:pyruvate/2-oxoglutarate dehydrogenase complex dihydrolipoamide acyltransferase (E2) component